MKRILFLVIAIMCILSLSCQKAQPPEGKKEVQARQEELKQPQEVEMKSEGQVKQQPEKAISQEPSEEKKKIPLAKELSLLTDEEKKEFKKFKGVFGQEGMSEKEVFQNLRILLKGAPDTIPYYQDSAYGDEKGRLEKYSEDFCNVMQQAASLKCKKCYDLILSAMKEKATPQSIRPSVRACAAETTGWYGG